MWCRSEVQQQVGFLQMMRWMLDTNFCGINGVAQKAGISIGIKKQSKWKWEACTGDWDTELATSSNIYIVTSNNYRL
jgi:hypothetical protein